MGAFNLKHFLRLLIMLTLLVFSSFLMMNNHVASAVGEKDYLNVDSKTIVIRDSNSVQFKVYPSDLTIFDDSSPTNDNRNKSLYFNGSEDSVGSPNIDERYEYTVRSLGRFNPFYLVEITPTFPFKNGTYELTIGLVGHKLLTISVIIDGDNGAAPPVQWEFDVKCANPAYNSPLKCIIYPELVDEDQAEEAELIKGKYSVTYFVRSISSKTWKKERSFSWDIQKAVGSTFQKITQPLDVKLEIRFEGNIYKIEPMRIYPKAVLKLTSPNAAIVGDNFLIQVSTLKQYSGKCFVNSQFEFNIKQGFGKIRVYGKTPGNLDIYVRCTSPNWASTTAYKFVYIRS